MKDMLTEDDLRKIGSLMDKRTDLVLATVKEGFDANDRRFDAVEGRLGSIEGTMVTKVDLDRKLGNAEARLTERYDRRYARK